MEEFGLMVEATKVAGVSIFLFLLFYYYMRKQFEVFEKTLADQAERDKRLLDATVKTFEKIIDDQKERDAQAFELQKDMIETLQHQAGVISRMEHKIDKLK